MSASRWDLILVGGGLANGGMMSRFFIFVGHVILSSAGGTGLTRGILESPRRFG
jgi:hypothetical protein